MDTFRRHIVLGILIILYVLIFGIFASFRHYNFETQALDMGIFTQTFWNTVHGRFMENTLEEIPNHFGVHFSPALLLLALGAIPLYLVALRKIVSKKLSILFAAAYLLYPGLHWLNIFDFHEIFS